MPIDHWGPCFVKIDTLHLHVTTDTKTSLELLGETIWKSFELICPGDGKHFHDRFALN